MPFKNVEDKRAYHRDWAAKNKEWWIKRKERNRLLIRKAKNKPCADCGKSYPYYVMDFDHLKDKTIDLSKLANKHWSEEKVLAEIAKCDVVCSNCHRIRTYKRGEKV